jgi:hypothetical protein
MTIAMLLVNTLEAAEREAAILGLGQAGNQALA